MSGFIDFYLSFIKKFSFEVGLRFQTNQIVMPQFQLP